MKRFFTTLITACSLSISLSAYALSDITQWEEAYADALVENKQRALSLLRDRYNALPPGVEKLYISSKIHGFMLLNGQPYHGNQHLFENKYSKQEQLLIEALNSEEQLDFITARHNYTLLLDQFDQSGNLDGKILIEYHLCRVLNRQSSFHEGEVYCSSLKTHIEDATNPILPKYQALRVIANNSEFIGKYQIALETYEELLNIIPSYIDSSGIYNDTGLLLANLGYFEKSKEYLQTSLDMRANTDIPLKLAQTHHSMGKVLLKQHQYEQAIEHFVKSKDISQVYNHQYGLTFAQLGIGQSYIGLNDHSKGISYLLDALDSATKQGNSHIRGEIYLTLADSHKSQNKYIAANDFALQAYNLALSIGSERLTSNSLKHLAEIAELQGNYSSALEYYRQYANSELKKRDKESKNAFIALDVARQNYLSQIENDNLISKNKLLHEQLDLIEKKSLIYGLVVLLLIATSLGQVAFMRKNRRTLLADGLSGALTRTGCINLIKKHPASTNLEYKSVVILVDLDRFKSINDSYGHVVGDTLLRHIVEVLKESINGNDIVGRIGGEEFILLLKEVDELDVQERVNFIHQTICNTHIEIEEEQPAQVTATIAYLSTTKALNDFDELFSILDQAMYQAKRNGKNQIIDAYNDPIYIN